MNSQRNFPLARQSASKKMSRLQGRIPDIKGFRENPIYITFDIDLFDPSEVPGTGTPEAGGIRWSDFESLRAVFDRRNIVGLDIVELSTELDPTGISSALAAKMLREWL